MVFFFVIDLRRKTSVNNKILCRLFFFFLSSFYGEIIKQDDFLGSLDLGHIRCTEQTVGKRRILFVSFQVFNYI